MENDCLVDDLCISNFVHRYVSLPEVKWYFQGVSWPGSPPLSLDMYPHQSVELKVMLTEEVC